MANMLQVKGADIRPYSILLETSWERLAEAAAPLAPAGRKLCIVTDSQVAPLYLDAVREALSGLELDLYEYVIPAGEENKTLAQIEQLYAFLIEHAFDRRDILAALGGGVVGDMTGFAAATYLRGIDFIQIPTTLLAQVDSSIGGKSGVDFSCYKNMVGAFKQPRLVYVNLMTLTTLPRRQLSSGMAEVIKHGCIRNRNYLERLTSLRDEVYAHVPGALEYLVFESLRIKKAVVEADPFEKGERALLNFGHTLGHALEKESGFSLTHGESVALGCVAASWISARRGRLSADELQRIEAVFAAFDLPIRYQTFDPEQILQAVRHDKKMEGNTIRFVLLDSPGCGRIDRSVTADEMRAALNYLQEVNS